MRTPRPSPQSQFSSQSYGSRLPTSLTLFYGPEAAHLGDLMRLWVRTRVRGSLSFSFSRTMGSMLDTVPENKVACPPVTLSTPLSLYLPLSLPPLPLSPVPSSLSRASSFSLCPSACNVRTQDMYWGGRREREGERGREREREGERDR